MDWTWGIGLEFSISPSEPVSGLAALDEIVSKRVQENEC